MRASREPSPRDREGLAERSAAETDRTAIGPAEAIGPRLDLSRLGNRSLLALHETGRLQRKARVSQPGEPREREADRAADAVVDDRPIPKFPRSGPSALVQRSASSDDQLMTSLGLGESRPPAPASLDEGLTLDRSTRQLMEKRFGETFEDVKIHTGQAAAESAAALQSRAFTVGQDIVFGDGEFAPETTEGRRLLAHELAHVVQQRQSDGPPATEGETERDAHDAAHQVASGGTAKVRERAAVGTVQRWPLTDVSTGVGSSGARTEDGRTVIDRTIEADASDVVVVYSVPFDVELKPRAWEDRATRVLYVDPNTFNRTGIIGLGRWSEVKITRGQPSPETPKRPAPTPPPPRKPAPPPKLPPVTPPPESRSNVPPPEVVQEVVIHANESDQSPPAPAPRDDRTVRERILADLSINPSEAAKLAPQLSDPEMEGLSIKERADLLGALATDADGWLDADSTIRLLHSTPPSQQRDLLEKLVGNDGRLLSSLRESVRPEDRARLEGELFMMQLAVDLRAGERGTAPNLADPLGARGFRPIIGLGRGGSFLDNSQFRVETSGDWTIQAPGGVPVTVERALSRQLRAERQNRQIASKEAQGLSPQAKVDRIQELAQNKVTGFNDEERIINILRYTSAEDAPSVLAALNSTKIGDVTLREKLDSTVDFGNNLDLHAELTALYLRSRSNDPTLKGELGRAPVLPWHDALGGDRAVFTTRQMPDGTIAVTYGTLQSIDLAHSKAMGPLPKELRNGGTMFVQPDQIVLVNDADSGRQIPLTGKDLIAYEHSGDRGAALLAGKSAATGVGLVFAPVVVAGGVAFGGGMNTIRQGAQMVDNPNREFSGGEVLDSALTGGALAPVIMYVPGAGYVMSAQGVVSARQEFGQGHKWTGGVDLAFAMLPFAGKALPKKLPGGNTARAITVAFALGIEDARGGMKPGGPFYEPQVILVEPSMNRPTGEGSGGPPGVAPIIAGLGGGTPPPGSTSVWMTPEFGGTGLPQRPLPRFSFLPEEPVNPHAEDLARASADTARLGASAEDYVDDTQNESMRIVPRQTSLFDIKPSQQGPRTPKAGTAPTQWNRLMRFLYEFNPKPNETYEMNGNLYSFDGEGRLVRVSGNRDVLGKRYEDVYSDYPNKTPGFDYGHVGGIEDFGHNDLLTGNRGGHPQEKTINRSGEWRQAEIDMTNKVADLVKQGKPYLKVAEVRNFVDGIPSEWRIHVVSEGEIVYDSKWLKPNMPPKK